MRSMVWVRTRSYHFSVVVSVLVVSFLGWVAGLLERGADGEAQGGCVALGFSEGEVFFRDEGLFCEA